MGWLDDGVRYQPGDHNPRANSPGFWGSWTLKAVCAKRGKDDERCWFPENGSNKDLWTLRARRICGTCKVRDDCLDYVLRMDLGVDSRGRTWGIWAGTTFAERGSVACKSLDDQFALLTELATVQIVKAWTTETPKEEE